MRSFKIVLLNKEEVNDKRIIKIKDTETPKIAAKQFQNTYLKPSDEIFIKEITKDSKKKIYGPY